MPRSYHSPRSRRAGSTGLPQRPNQVDGLPSSQRRLNDGSLRDPGKGTYEEIAIGRAIKVWRQTVLDMELGATESSAHYRERLRDFVRLVCLDTLTTSPD